MVGRDTKEQESKLIEVLGNREVRPKEIQSRIQQLQQGKSLQQSLEDTLNTHDEKVIIQGKNVRSCVTGNIGIFCLAMILGFIGIAMAMTGSAFLHAHSRNPDAPQLSTNFMITLGALELSLIIGVFSVMTLWYFSGK